jgi:hypothetical protein
MLVPWLLGLPGVVWYATSWHASRSRASLAAFSILACLVAGIVAYIALIAVALVISRLSSDSDGLLPLVEVLKLAALGAEIWLAVAAIRWFARRHNE